MANTVANVLVGKPLSTGGVYVAPLGTTLPGTATAALNGAFASVGYIGEDGLTETAERSTDKIRAWGGDIVKVVQSEFSVAYSFTMVESLNNSALDVVYGEDNVTGSAGVYAVTLNAAQLDHKAFVFEVKDGDAKVRIVVPDGQVTEVGEVVYSDEELIGYQVTVEAFLDNGIGGQAKKYLDSGAVAAVPSIAALAPSAVAAAGGELVIITGANFTGVTAVGVAAVAVDVEDWEFISDSKIALITPAKAAGARAVVVTTPAGASAGVDLTYS